MGSNSDLKCPTSKIRRVYVMQISGAGAVQFLCSTAPPGEPTAALRRDDGGVRPGAPSRCGGRLRQPLMKPGTDLLGRQLSPLPLFTGDDDTCGRNTGETSETENLPEIHDQEPFRE